MTFEEYLLKKRINKEAFAAEDPARFQAWESMYAQMHPNSFYVAVKMVLNNVRLRYHLPEEDVPKPAPTAAPRPAARRAAAPAPKSDAESTAAIPATPDVPQETTEEKPVMPAAALKPRPVVRRPAALKTPTTEDQSASEKPAEETIPTVPKAKPVIKRPVIPKPAAEAYTDKPAEADVPAPMEPAVPRARPVIKRPAALAKPEEQTGSQEQNATAIPEPTATSEASAEPAKPARPRPVIKRPAALQKPSQGEEQAAPEKLAEGIASESEAAAEAPKPARPRPVIKRPAALQKPAEQQQSNADTEDQPTAAEAASTGIENPDKPASADTPKPPRPRPVIRRPPPKTEE